MTDTTSSIQAARARFDAGNFIAARDLYQQLLAHHPTDSAELVLILRGLGHVMAELGDLPNALTHLRRALKLSEKFYGATHAETAETLHTLGGWEFESGEYQTGLKLVQRALAIRQQLLGTEHADTLDSMRMVALQQRFLKQPFDAVLQQAREITERVYGDKHQITAKVYTALASSASQAESKTLYERALTINENLKGPDDPYNVTLLSNVALAYARANDTETALKINERAINLTERIYGANHYRVAMSLWTSADAYEQQGDDANARRAAERALIISERALGATHFITVKSLRDLVTLYGNIMSRNSQRQMEEMQAMMKSGQMNMHMMRPQSRDHTVDSLSITLYQILNALDDSNDQGMMMNMFSGKMSKPNATAKLREIVDRLDADHKHPAVDPSALANVKTLVEQADQELEAGRMDQAETKLKEAISLQEKLLGISHLDHVPLLKKLIMVKEQQGQESEVLPLLQQIADIYVTELGADHPETLMEMMNLRARTQYEYGHDAGNNIMDQMINAVEQFTGNDSPLATMMKKMQGLGNLFGGIGKPSGQERGEALSKRREAALANIPPERAALLEGIEDVNWASFDHAYGAATDVPRMLRLLLADDNKVRDSAWDDITNSLMHQGSLYSATVQIVPFLIKLLDTVERTNILQFFSEGIGAIEVFYDEEEEEEYSDAYTDEFRAAVGKGVPEYLRLLSDQDEFVLELVLGILIDYSEQADVILPALRERLKNTRDEEQRDYLENAIEKLTGKRGK